MMKSNKQRRAEIMAAREQKRRARDRRRQAELPPYVLKGGAVPVDRSRLVPQLFWPDWAVRGYYEDRPFRCRDCGAHCVWPASRQKWWYEVAKGHPDTTAVRCKPCRAKERARKEAARRVAMAGLMKKLEAKEQQ